MAITVKDIHEKEFSKVNRGYNVEEVDDFLDAIAEQLEQLIRERNSARGALANAQAEAKRASDEAEAARKALEISIAEADSLKAEAAKAQEAAAEAQAVQPADEQLAPVAAVPAVTEVAAAPTFNEPSYFKNLETTLRETLISAQRIADETIDDARKRARKIVSEAEEQAASVSEQSAVRMAEAKVDYDALRNASEEYRRLFSELVEGQTKLLKESPLFT